MELRIFILSVLLFCLGCSKSTITYEEFAQFGLKEKLKKICIEEIRHGEELNVYMFVFQDKNYLIKKKAFNVFELESNINLSKEERNEVSIEFHKNMSLLDNYKIKRSCLNMTGIAFEKNYISNSNIFDNQDKMLNYIYFVPTENTINNFFTKDKKITKIDDEWSYYFSD